MQLELFLKRVCKKRLLQPTAYVFNNADYTFTNRSEEKFFWTYNGIFKIILN